MKYSNKRIAHRTSGGRFRAAQLSDVGIGGVCPVCHHFLINVYDGDPNDQHPDPRLFRARCFTCEPETEVEAAARIAKENAAPKFSIMGFLRTAEREA